MRYLALLITLLLVTGPAFGTDRAEKQDLPPVIAIIIDDMGHNLIEGERLTLDPGEAMLLPRGTRFLGWNDGPEGFLGVAQHFTLSVHGEHDLIAQMDLARKVRLSRWDVLEPMIRHYRQSAPPRGADFSAWAFM